MSTTGGLRTTDSSPAKAAVGLLLLTAAGWVIALRQMDGMDMGVATRLGSLWSFVAVWVSMMAAMMLPGAAPAASLRARATGRLRAVPLFAAAYLAVWTVVGLVVYVLYRPYGASAAGALTIAAGIYEFTPLKRACRRRCRESGRSGFGFGVFCVGSSVGLMLVLVALGPMSVMWMAVVGGLVLVQKLVPPRAAVDVPLALAIVGLGIATVL